MAGEKASFYARDVSPSSSYAKSNNGKKFMGVEKRRYRRRSGQDRRADIRFDIKGDRRQNNGRREEDAAPQFW